MHYRRCGRNLQAKLYTVIIISLSANHAYLKTLYLSIYLSIYLCMCVHTTAMRSGIAWWRYRAPVSPADRQLSNRAEDQQFRPVRLGGRHHVRRCRSSRVRRRLSRLLRCTQGTTAVPINRQLLSHFL